MHVLRPVLFLLVAAASSNAQSPQRPTPEEVVNEWMARWVRLDGTEQTAARFAELYAPDGDHLSGPSPRQMGLVHYEGRSDILQMARRIGETRSEMTFKIQSAQGGETTREILHLGEGPWGGPSVAIEFVSAFTGKDDKKRYVSVGALFFQLKDGLIRRTRIYSPREETMEIHP